MEIEPSSIIYRDGDFLLGKSGGKYYLCTGEQSFQLSSYHYEPCLYIKGADGFFLTIHHAFTLDELCRVAQSNGSMKMITGDEYDMQGICMLLRKALTLPMESVDIGYLEARCFADYLEKCGAVSEETAVPLADWGIKNPNVMNSLLHANRQDKRITEAELYIVKPGDMVRLCPVKEAIEARCRLDGKGLFPGYTSDLRQAGEGVLHALKDCSVIVVGRHWGGFQDGLIDMGGPGQKHTYFGELINVVLVGDTDEEFERYEQQKVNDALRRAGHKLAEYIGQCVKELEPEDVDVYETEPLVKRSAEKNGRPGVVAVIQPQSQMETLGYNTLYYGWDMNRYLPSYMTVQEVLDGALVSGSFMPTSSKWSTYDFQNFPILRRMIEEQGDEYNFLGVILANLNVAMDQKERAAQILTNIAVQLGADYALVTEEGYGNPDADYVLAISNLEKAGIKVVAVANESTGRDGGGSPLVTLDERIVAMVSTGNVGQLIELPPMPVVLGELEALGRDGNSGGWDYDEVLGPSVRPDGSVIMEDNGIFCGDQTVGWSYKTMKDF